MRVVSAAPIFGAVVSDTGAGNPYGVRFVPGAVPGSVPALAWGSYDGPALNETGTYLCTSPNNLEPAPREVEHQTFDKLARDETSTALCALSCAQATTRCCPHYLHPILNVLAPRIRHPLAGWSVLDVHGNDTVGNDTLIAFAAGYLEGAFTFAEMATYAANTGALAPNSQALQAFLDKNYAWMVTQVRKFASRDQYWAHVGLLLAQVDGLVAGQLAAGGALNFTVVYNAIIQGGDIFNLLPLYGASKEQAALARGHIGRLLRDGVASTEDALQTFQPTDSRVDHCSALVRLTPDRSDILVGHSTWSGFEFMGRILKRFDLAFSATSGGDPVPGRHVATSSYPAFLSYSSDDFYVMSSGLITTETTINNDNRTLAKQFASHEVVLEWARNVLANRLASDAFSWTDTFSRYASGTYTNSWMIVDSNLFTPYAATLQPGTFVLLEEMPGYIAVHDESATLSTAGYWGSYNVPADPFIFNISGQFRLVEKFGGPTSLGAFFTLNNTTRARIFARNVSAVVDEPSMAAILRYNNFQNDPLGALFCGSNPPYSAMNAIADRSDLNPKNGSGSTYDYLIPLLGHSDTAAIDSKYTRVSWMQAANTSSGGLQLAAISSPTYDQLPAFRFSNSTVKVKHTGLPDVFQFPWIRQPWPV